MKGGMLPQSIAAALLQLSCLFAQSMDVIVNIFFDSFATCNDLLHLREACRGYAFDAPMHYASSIVQALDVMILELGLRTAWVLLLRGRDVKRGDTLVTAGPSELDALIILADGRFSAVFVQMRSPVSSYTRCVKFFFCVT